ncbi:hypothetical protein [Mycoplasma capricolum]|uniref:hypothetical protein n=1 Tax=Mycoplasma capricolum TaxID=2095 RepID=UPI0004D7A6A6|nr:hypothetical protein [Mycoplasma capricolum]KEY84495.1 hypothetical protein MCCP_4400 [Mycoplasma capricolum subsp. capripneumoniae 99108]WGD32975.1 hypothetical protein Mccp14020TZ_04860 [Mycoplasma capricolum subsp. capripneumoniae]
MKKLLVLLSSSIFFSLTTLSIYVLNSKNINQVPSFILKQKEQKEQKEETDLSKIFDREAYISIKDRFNNTNEKIINTIKGKYPKVDISQIKIEIQTDRNYGTVDIVLSPKDSNSKYIGKSTIPCYKKYDIKDKIEDFRLLHPETIDINTKENILNILKKRNISKQLEIDFEIKNIKESSAILVGREFGDYYGETEIKFKSKKITLNSVIDNLKIKLTKLKNDEVVKIIKSKYPSLKDISLLITIDDQKKNITIKANENTKFYGSVVLLYDFDLPKPMLSPKKNELISKSPISSEVIKNKKNDESLPKEEILDKKTNKLVDSEMSLDKLQKEKSLNQPFEPKEQPNEKKPKKIMQKSTSDVSEHKKQFIEPMMDKELKQFGVDKNNNHTSSVIDKSKSSSTTNSKILQIPNKKLSNSNKDSKSSGSKTGAIVGSTLGVGSIVASGAAGSWFYFKKRK